MNKNEIAEMWKSLAAKFQKEGNKRWADYCQMNAEIWSMVDATEGALVV